MCLFDCSLIINIWPFPAFSPFFFFQPSGLQPAQVPHFPMIKCKRLYYRYYVLYYNLNCKQLEIAHTTRHHTVSYSAQQRFSITSEHEAQSNTRHKKSKRQINSILMLDALMHISYYDRLWWLMMTSSYSCFCSWQWVQCYFDLYYYTRHGHISLCQLIQFVFVPL